MQYRNCGRKFQGSPNIAQPKTRFWNDPCSVGKLYNARQGHSVIFDETRFLVVGGYEAHRHEQCLLNNGNFTCSELEASKPALDYAFYPELYLTNGTFGDDCTNEKS